MVKKFSIQNFGTPEWPEFAELVEKHHGIWGGCWCIAFHHRNGHGNGSVALNRAEKESLVRAGQAHAALVYDGERLVGWCQFGPPGELPARMSSYGRLGVAPPDWRITCFFVDRDHRKEGVARAGLEGALRIIAERGGGTVDGYPTVTRGKPTSNSFLWSGTSTMFERVGFKRIGVLGKSKWMMRRTVRPRVRRSVPFL